MPEAITESINIPFVIKPETDAAALFKNPNLFSSNPIDLNKIEQEFKKDIKELSKLEKTENIFHSESITNNSEEKSKIEHEIKLKIFNLDAQAEEELNRKRVIINNLGKFEQKFKRIIKLIFVRRLQNIWQTDINHQIKINLLADLKKRRIFSKLNNACVDKKWNRYYIGELIKMKMNIFTINNILEKKDDRINKNTFFNYNDVKNLLLSKLIENQNFHLESIDKKQTSLYSLKITIFTEKKIFISSRILQLIFKNIDMRGLEVEEGLNFINISNKNNFDESLNNYFSIFISVIFIDQILDMPLFINDNINILNKFTYGLIYIDYTKISSIQNLTILLDYSTLNATQKELLLLNYFKLSYSSIDIENYKINIQILEEKYKCKKTNITLFPIKDFNLHFIDVIELYNNMEFFSIFENFIQIHKLKDFQTISVFDYYSQLRFSDIIISYLNTKENFITEKMNVNDPNWIRFFVHVRKNNLFIKFSSRCL